MSHLPFLLVAEKSVLPTLPFALEGLRRWSQTPNLTLVVPSAQRSLFAPVEAEDVDILVDEEVLPDISKAEIERILGPMGWRAGWYLQQFIKLGYAAKTFEDRYVIWDADTVLLEKLEFFNNEKIIISKAKEYNQPYFATYEKLFGEKSVLPHSVISQYMPIDSAKVRTMLATIEGKHGQPWTKAILSVLPRKHPSEFSEYETYGNFIAANYKDFMELVSHHWFRFGSELFTFDGRVTNQDLEKKFLNYTYVAFERHPINLARRMRAQLFFTLHLSS